MTDEELMALSIGMPITYCDGFGAYRQVNGLLRCVGYALNSGIQLNLAVSLIGANHAQAETRRVLNEEPSRCLQIWNGMNLPH